MRNHHRVWLGMAPVCGSVVVVLCIRIQLIKMAGYQEIAG